MKMLLTLIVLGGLSALVTGRPLDLDSCTINVHTQELRRHLSIVRSDAVMGDGEIGVKLLDSSLARSTQDGQKCCLIHLVLRFYIERVFNNYAAPQAESQRRCSSLANAFLTIRKDILKCQCNCTEGTQRSVDSLHAAFNRMEIRRAAQKAVGELGTVLEWLERLGSRSLE
ncbi:interleukin 19 like [Brachionichthys hirsutus]|uniref:interleukin 19 like n=1 Tax=Brachionichthys hirsutus TaxID=412623 RepID=UPI003604F23B